MLRKKKQPELDVEHEVDVENTYVPVNHYFFAYSLSGPGEGATEMLGEADISGKAQSNG